MTTGAQFKKTDIGLIPVDWTKLNLGKSASLKARIGWQGLTTAEYLDSGDYSLITGTDFKNGYIDWDNCVFVEKNRFDQDRNIQIKLNDVLVTKDGTIGKVALINKIKKPATLNSGVFVIRPISNSFNPKYFYYVLRSNHFKDFLEKLSAGSTINHLYQKDFVYYSFPLPPLPEQEAIAEVLSDTDALIGALEKRIAKKRLIKQGAIQTLLTPKDDWEVKKLGEVASFFKGKGLPKSALVSEGKFKCIHYGELFTQYEERITEYFSYTDKTDNCFYSKKNDVLMPTSDVTPNGLATASCVLEDNVILGGDILVIRIPDNVINGIFLSYSIKKSREQVMKLVTGSTVYHIYGSDMANFVFKYPKIEEQNRIATILSDIDNEIDALEKKLAKTKKLKQGLMQQLLTGKIRLV